MAVAQVWKKKTKKPKTKLFPAITPEPEERSRLKDWIIIYLLD